jgi:hypothetical protein
MKISTLKSQNIKACVAFNYRGYQISLSNICPTPELIIFRSEQSFKSLFCDAPSPEGIKRAMEFIDNLLDK